jgi:hypothetical protein
MYAKYIFRFIIFTYMCIQQMASHVYNIIKITHTHTHTHTHTFTHSDTHTLTHTHTETFSNKLIPHVQKLS